MNSTDLKITTASGEKTNFSLEKIGRSLKKSGADEASIRQILHTIESELYEGISTREVYNRAFELLKEKDSVLASRYKLKKAIYELGPTGYPFEKFVGALLAHTGYKVEVGKVVQGICVTHEVDVVAQKDKVKLFIECKFHSEQGRYCNVKIPLYIHSRFRDIENHYRAKHDPEEFFNEGWVVTNTRFTSDAVQYAKCVGLTLLGWDFPKGAGLKERIDHAGLYPITVSTLLSRREKEFLLSRDVVLCQDLVKDKFFLDHLGVSETRKKKILKEMRMLCTVQKKDE
ncbi:restriction endonuclease [Salinimicrobium catena]|uniref:restriction endonuclease n=1 Tax=Salinimicrobium catena TaxID=390640 RepID=UPI002FE46111